MPIDPNDPAVASLIAEGRPHAVSILILDRGLGLGNPACVVDQGSGLLLRTESTRFILTAKHVIDGYRGRHVGALGATSGQNPVDITNWRVIDESAYLDLATIEVPRGFDERDIGKLSLNVAFPLPRAQEGEACLFFGFPGLHRRVESGGLRVGLSPICDFVVSVSERGFVIADELGEREAVDFQGGALPPFGPTGGVSGGAVMVRRGTALTVCGIVYEGGDGVETPFFGAHANALRADGTLDHSMIPG